jgi:hypothetical protein
MTFPKSINTRANFEVEGEVNVEATQNQVGGAWGAQSEESEEDPDPVVQAYKEKQDEMQVKIDDFKANVHPCVPEKNNRYFDFRHLKIYPHPNTFYNILQVIFYGYSRIL